MGSMNVDKWTSLVDVVVHVFEQKGVANASVVFESPVDFDFCDITTNAAMRYAKEIGVSPLVLAEDIAEALRGHVLVDSVEVKKPGYVNVFLKKDYFIERLRHILESKHVYGRNEFLKGKKFVVEHTSPNPNKMMHLGHLRNNVIGMGIVNLLSWCGAEVIPEAVDNDRGIALAKVMYGFLQHMRKKEFVGSGGGVGSGEGFTVDDWVASPRYWFTPEEKAMKPGVFVSECYTLAEKDCENPDVLKEVQGLVQRWEDNEKNVWKLWRHVLRYAYESRNVTLARLGSRWDREWHESDHYGKGKEYVLKGVKEGIFQELEDGAVLTSLERFDLPDTILLRGDGTSLYITQDIALTDSKQHFYDADALLWVVGVDQDLAMRQLFAVCEQLQIGTKDLFQHISYGYVSLVDTAGEKKRMSSRKGVTVLIDDLIDEVKKVVLDYFESEGREYTSQLDRVAETLALGAVKFAFLKVERTKNLLFNVDDSVQTSGASGVYLLYTLARARTLLASSDATSFSDVSAIGSEKHILQLVDIFPDIVERSRKELSLHHIAQYALELSAAFNSWYASEKVLDGSEMQSYKLAVVQAVHITLKNSLNILGINTVDRI